MENNVTLLPNGNTEIDKKKLLEDFKANLSFHLEYATIVAEVVRKRYLVLVANGFTEAQALELCWRPLA